MKTDDLLLQADRDARKAAIDVRRSMIVQAPAGSGKTELLIQRYLTLLATVDDPEEVLAITFTLKAAAEMRLRVVQALERAQSGTRPEEAHEQITHDAALRALQRDAERDWRLTQSPGRMRIQTLDAFNASIARLMPVSSGLGQPGRTIVDEEMNSLQRDAAAATLDWLHSGGTRSDDVQNVLRHLDNNSSIFINYVARMLAARDQWLPIVGGRAVAAQDASMARKGIEQALASLIGGHLGDLRSRFTADTAGELAQLIDTAASNLLEAGNPDHPLASLKGITDLPAGNGDELEAWRAVTRLLLISDGKWRRSINVRDGFPPGAKADKDRLFELIDELREVDDLHGLLVGVRLLPTPAYSDEQWSVLLSLFEVLRIATGELAQLFDDRGVADHTEIALAANRALGTAEQPGEVALMLDYRLRHLLVDEMQDTSIAQYRLVEKLTAGWQRGDGRTLFCVGDPMQSIYRFRDAEVGRFVQAQKTGIGDIDLDVLTLRRNFRSEASLVHWFNTVFSQIMPLEDDIANGSVAYSESIPGRDASEMGKCEIHALVDATPEQEAETAVRAIQQCVSGNPDDSRAVLVRSRTHLRFLLPRLRRAGIAYQIVEIDRLTDLPEIIDVLALTRALCHESDRLAWLAVLRGPWVGLSWRDLHALVVNDTASTVMELLGDRERTATLSNNGRKLATNFVEVLDKHRAANAVLPLRDRLESAWFELGGPALLQDAEQVENVYRYFDIVDKLSYGGTLPDPAELETQLDSERVSNTSEAGGRLQIMTMHKAKGLQFDHVFLPGLGRRPRGRRAPLLNWLTVSQDGKDDTMIVSPVGPRADLEQDSLHKYIESVEKQKDRHELDRLLYVACTRARKSLHLIGSAATTKDGDALRLPEADTALAHLWPTISAEFERVYELQNDDEVKDMEEPETFAMPVSRRLDEPWIAPRPKSLPDLPGEQSHDRPRRAVEYYWVGTSARHAGTIVHRWLQRLARKNPTADEFRRDDARNVSELWARQLGVGDDDIRSVCDRVELALQNTLSDDRGRWLLDGLGHAEYALTGMHDGKLQSIVIDRILIDEDGCHWIVDYKTSSHEGGDLDGFLQQEADRYRDQLTAYRTIYSTLVDAPVRTALYFPLLQRLEEVNTTV